MRSGNSIWIYLLTMIVVTNIIRIIPVTLIRKQITNKFIHSFLHYVPYVTLAVMTFPAIVEATDSALAGSLAFVIGIVGAWLGLGLLPEAFICCAVVLITEYLAI